MARYLLGIPSEDKSMLKPTNRDGYSYVRFLLQEKQRELQILELRLRQKLILLEDYFSCRRSLLQGICQLETLLSDENTSDFIT
jgi:hypothetical protein